MSWILQREHKSGKTDFFTVDPQISLGATYGAFHPNQQKALAFATENDARYFQRKFVPFGSALKTLEVKR